MDKGIGPEPLLCCEEAVTKLPKLALVVSQDDVIAEIRTGSFKEASLIKRSGLSRARVRKLIAEHAPTTRIKLPSRKMLPAVVQVPSLPPPVPADAAPILPWLIGGVCGLIGAGFCVGNAIMNLRFGVSLATDDTSRWVLGGLSLAIDLGAFVLLAAAEYLWENRRYRWLPPPLCLCTFLTWLLCVGLSIGAALGFASSNVGDALQARGTVAEQRVALIEQRSRAETDRRAIGATGNPQVLENQMIVALGSVPTKNRVSSEDCTKPTLSATVCADYNRLKDAYTAAKARADIDTTIATLTMRIAALPAIGTKDSGAEQIAQMSFGLATPEQARNYLMRCFAIISVIGSGLLLAIARSMLR